MLLYIDPGTGSMLFTVVIGAFSAAVYLVRNIFMKAKMSIGKDKSAKINTNKLPIVIFSDHKRYWNTFEPICRELDKRGQKTYFYTLSPDDPALKASFKNVECSFIGEGNKGISRMNLLNAYVVLSTTPSLNVYQWKRSKNVNHYSHILHMVTDPSTYRMFGLDHYDSILFTGEYQVKQMEKIWEGRNISPKELKVVGCPYMDDMLKRFESSEASKKEKDKKTVLVAPSWGPSGILTVFGESIIEALLKTDYNIIIRPHPQSFTSEKELMDSLMTKYPDSNRLSWNRDNDNFNCLSSADIMISDFSGVIFDYALIFDRPIIYTTTDFNRDVYDAYFLKDDLWVDKILPCIGKNLNKDNLKDIDLLIEECLTSDTYREGKDKARKESWVNIGSSASITADFLIDKLNEYTKEMEEEV